MKAESILMNHIISGRNFFYISQMLFEEMNRERRKNRPIKWHVDWLGGDYPVNLFIERRPNSRVSFGRSALNIRLSAYLNEEQRRQQLEKFLAWARKVADEKGIPGKRSFRNYAELDSLQLMEEDFEIRFTQAKRKTVGVKVEAQQIIIKAPETLSIGEDEQISNAVSRSVGKFFHQNILERLSYFNQQHFDKPFKDLRLKHNHSNWGSCSNRGNINISTKLLQAPTWVVDYVLIHELSHLVHPNHSIRFWRHVEKIYPEYRKAEKWLKECGPNCYY